MRVAPTSGSVHARRKRLQRPSHSVLTPSAIFILVRSRSLPEHRAQDADEQQRCDGPMKPDSMRTGEEIDENQKARNGEDRCDGARQVRQPIRDRAHPCGWLVPVANPLSAGFRGCNRSSLESRTFASGEAMSPDAAHRNSIADDGNNVLHLSLAEAVKAKG